MAQVHTLDLRSQGQKVKLFPALPPGPPDLDGRINSHVLCALGHYNLDIEANLFSFVDLSVVSRGGSSDVLSVDLHLLGSWEHPGNITDVQLAELGSSEVLLALASSNGGVTLGRLLLPRTPGTGPDDIQIIELATEEGEQRLEQALVQLHRGSVASIDVQSDSKALLTVGADGGICVFNANAQGSVTPFKRSASGCVSYTNGRWADSNLFATTSSLGSLEMWDVRSGPTPVARAPAGWGQGSSGLGSGASSGPAQAHSLHIHPARPDLCATGGSTGEVVWWDLRFASQPTVVETGAEDVWEVRFDPLRSTSAGSTQPSLLACTAGGLIASASAGSGKAGSAAGSSVQPLLQSPYSVNSFDVEATLGLDVVGVTEGQELVYIRRQG